MRQRVSVVKRSTVRVLVNSRPVGTGFVAANSGLIVTCFHVVQYVKQTGQGPVSVQYAAPIEVEYFDGTRASVNVHPSCQNQGLPEALSKDYCILEPAISTPVPPLIQGRFADVEEGSEIYLCGFPFGIDQPVVARGLLSTKWSCPGHLGQGSARDVAWIDITMNKGNSGGPVVLLAPDPGADRVIGIASFGLNPFANQAEQIAATAQATTASVHMLGVDFKKFSVLIGSALASNSVGVGGTVAIDHVLSVMP